MAAIRSPLGALGALMVLIDAIAASALVPLRSQPDLQKIVVLALVSSIGLVTLVVCGLIVFLAIRRPGLLFSPADIDPSIHADLYGPRDEPQVPTPVHPVSFEIVDLGDVDTDGG